MNKLEQEVYDNLADRIYCMVTIRYELEVTSWCTHVHWMIDEVSERMTIQEARDSNKTYHRPDGFCIPFHYRYIPKKKKNGRWELSHSQDLHCNPYISPVI